MSAFLLAVASTPARAWMEARALDTMRHPDTVCCRHVAAGGQDLAVALWSSRTLLCPACAPMSEPDQHERHVCDRCGLWNPTTANVLISGRDWLGRNITVLAGLCATCDRHLDVRRPPRTRNRAQRRRRGDTR